MIKKVVMVFVKKCKQRCLVSILQTLGIPSTMVARSDNNYAGQTKNRFSMRWPGHRNAWNSHCLKNRDQVALRTHFNKNYHNFINHGKKNF